MDLKGIAYLRRKLALKACRVRLRYRYYEMKNSVQNLGAIMPAELARFATILGWCAKGVDSLADRLAFAELVLHRALEMANLPPEISCAAMLSENLFVDAEERRVRLRYMLRPLPEMNPRELALLAGDQVKKILPRRRTALEAEWAFRDELEQGLFHSVVALYARWREAQRDIRQQQEEFEAKKKQLLGI